MQEPVQPQSCRKTKKLCTNSGICAPGLGLHSLPHAPNLTAAVLAIEVDAQAVQDSKPLVAVFLILGTAPDSCRKSQVCSNRLRHVRRLRTKRRRLAATQPGGAHNKAGAVFPEPAERESKFREAHRGLCGPGCLCASSCKHMQGSVQAA